MMKMLSSHNSKEGFHADPVVIVHSSEVNGHTRRQKFIFLTIVGTLVFSALIIGSVLLVKSLASKSAKSSTAKMDSSGRYVVTFEPALDNLQISTLTAILKTTNPNAQISDSFNGGIFIEGTSALDDAKAVFKTAINMNVSEFYTITNVYNGDILFRHCINVQDPRCSSNGNYPTPGEQCVDTHSCRNDDYPAPDQQYVDTDSYRKDDCPPGFLEPDCTDCIPGRYGPNCEYECGDCGRGVCNDGIHGDGHCICPDGFGGDCKECLPWRYGSDCLGECACKKEWGICDDGINGNGTCTCINNHIVGDICDRCDVGWTGGDCTLAKGIVGLNAFNYCGDNPGLFAVTFDGWPSDEILQDLDISKFKATFFVRPGTASNNSCSLVQDALRRGHSIQLGGYNGEVMEAMTEFQLQLQLDASLVWLQECLDPNPIAEITQLRPPLERFDNGRARFVSELGFTVVTWNIDGNVGLNFSKLLEEFNSLKGNSSILIRYDASPYSHEMLFLAGFLQNFRPELSKRFVVTRDCYVACTGGGGVCRTDKGPGVFDSYQAITRF